MDIETFRKRFVDHSDEDLILMLTKNASKYNPDALVVAKEILVARNIDIDAILKEANEKKIAEEKETEKRHIEDLSPLEQIEYLSERRLEFEENIEDIIEDNHKDLTDAELLENFESILDKIIENGNFGELTESYSKENYFIVSNIIEQRSVKIPVSVLKKIDRINDITRKDFSRKFTRNIIIGIVLLALGLVFTIGTGGGLVFYGAVLSGLGLVINGIAGKRNLKRGAQIGLESYG
ncbi:hypothetical protein SAMN06265349_101158 [Flavobacterium resistens]|uniref:Uncharacterized protein n=1 Tax=Flavobacterium resistens TaxID=443612 RepID=A0A521AIU9_9FLAO|nr:hypothetical protein [Flavobacterium resistens]MRX69914.1 hypothetical protein [Flavobacterium resistens]SMO34736.1 hypothetical protein SAMN06265349_101158 [Flavobacterium resistens]